MINYYDNLNLGGTSELLSGARIHIRPSSDKVSLSAHAFSGAQTSPIVEVKTSTGSDIFKISNAMIDLYSDLRANTGSNIIMSAHSTRIVSGHYIAPLISNALLSGSLNANSTRITSLSPATAMTDAVTLNQTNTAVSGSLFFRCASSAMTSNEIADTSEVLLFSKVLSGIVAGDQIELELFGTIENDSSNPRLYTYTANLGTFSVSLGDSISTSPGASDQAILRLRAIFSIAGSASAGCIFMSERTDIIAINTPATIAESNRLFSTTASNLTGVKTASLGIYSDSFDTRQDFTLHSYSVRKLPNIV